MIISHANETPKVPGKASQFTGVALGDSVMPATDGVIINTVSFEPGARTHWHVHERGQLLIVVSGYGLICAAGENPKKLRTGSWVWIPPGEKHWHGAAPDAFFTHTAISFGATYWSDPVTTGEYDSPIEGDNHDQ